jgi:plastocyanin
MMKMRIAMVSAVALALVACGGGGGGSNYSSPTGTTGTTGTTGNTGTTAPTNTFQATDGLSFNPTTLTVTKGQVVTFSFGSVTHNVVFATGSGVTNIPDSHDVSTTRQFNTAGTFSFQCSIHGGYMAGQITVQ